MVFPDGYGAIAVNHHFKDVILHAKDSNSYQPIPYEVLTSKLQQSMNIQ